MGYARARRLVRLSLLAALGAGGLNLLFAFVWVPAYQASSVEVILTPDELRDRRLIEVVHRTHRLNAQSQGALVGPYRVFGAATVLSAVVGLAALRDVPGPLVPGILGMRKSV